MSTQTKENVVLRIIILVVTGLCLCRYVDSSVLGTSTLFPGTMWCGAGNVADARTDLGIYSSTDRCCRSHDLCPVRLTPFKSDFGLTNFRPHTVMHCDCDNAFRSCLRLDDSRNSRIVGDLFFNQLRPPCFVLTDDMVRQCVERTWYGTCATYKEVRKGEWRQAAPFAP